MKWMPIVMFAVLMALGGAGGEEAAMGASGKKPAVGDDAPRFSLPGSDGATHSLSDHLGKRAVIIAWFPKAFTGG